LSEKIEKGLTLKAVILGSAIVILFTWLFSTAYFTRGAWTHQLVSGHSNNIFGRPFGLAFLVMLLIAAINKYKKIFSLQEAVIIYTIIWVGFSTGQGGFCAVQEYLGSYPAGIIYYGEPHTSELWSLVSPMFGPKDISVYDGVFKFGAQVPWGEWLVPLAWNIGYILSAMFFMVFWTNLLARHLYIDVERLPFPIATEGTRLVESTQPSARGVNYFSSMFFWIGFIITMLWMGVPTLMYIVQPVVGTQLYNTDFLNLFCQDLTAGEAAGVLGWFGLFLQLAPHAVGFSFWMPLEILKSFIVFYIIIALLPCIFSAVGYWPAAWPGTLSAFRVHKLFMMGYYPMNWQPVMYGSAIILGAGAALAIWPLITMRHEIGPILKSLWKRTPREVDGREPIPCRYLVIGTIIFAVLWLVFGIASSMTWWMMLLAIAASALWYLGGLRLRAETGGVGWGWGMWTSHWGPGCLWYLMLYVACLAFGMYYPNMATSTAMIVLLWGGPLGYQWFMHGTLTTASCTPMESYKMGSLTKSRIKDVFIAICLAIVIGIITSAVSFLYWLYYLDWSGVPGYTAISSSLKTQGIYFDLWSYSQLKSGTFYNAGVLTKPGANYVELYVSFAAAFAVVIILYILRGRGRAFGLHPVGLMLAATAGYYWWFSFLIAYILKYLVIRVGGTDVYTKKALPLMTGLVVGGAVTYFLWTFFYQLHALGFYGTPIG